jgi:DNA-binding transcriptional LysR family regulator
MADNIPDRIRRLREHDLNLLTGLYLLLDRRGVSEAATDMGLSQPAMSKMLERLRSEFRDRLLVRTGNQMVLTPFARVLLSDLERLINGLVTFYEPAEQFDPRLAERTVSIGMNEFLQYILGPSIIRMLQEKAPLVNLRLRPIHFGQAESEVVKGHVDLLVGAAGVEFNLRSSILYRDKLGCIASLSNDALNSPLAFSDFARMQQVYVSPSGFDFFPTVINQFLGGAGREPQPSDVTMSSYFAAARSIVGTNMVALLPNKLIASLFNPQIRVVPLAFVTPDYDVALWWHTTLHDDPFFTWLRRELTELIQHTALLPAKS